VAEETEPADDDVPAAPAVPPRAWVHPSELPNFQGGPPPSTSSSHHLAKIAAAAVALGLLAGVATVAVRRQPAPAPATSASTVATAPRLVQPAAASMVGLRITTPGAPSSEAAALIVDGSRSLVVTTAIVPSGASVTILTEDHRALPAAVEATDPIAGLSLLRAEGELPSPSVTAAASEVDQRATEVWLSSSSTGVERITWASTTLSSPDAPVVVDQVGIGTMTDSSSVATMAGAALVAPDGSLLGIAAPELGLHHWLPAALVESLASSSAAMSSHGCLKIEGKTAAEGGVQVLSVEASGPAAGLLEPGDLVTGIGTSRLRTISELLDDLYATAPGTTVELDVNRGGAVVHVGVSLASST
jgi:S1-C subfamily serine protease